MNGLDRGEVLKKQLIFVGAVLSAKFATEAAPALHTVFATGHGRSTW
jgi:hypothetical protein